MNGLGRFSTSTARRNRRFPVTRFLKGCVMDAQTATDRDVRPADRAAGTAGARMLRVYTGLHRERSTRKTLARFAHVAREAWRETRRCASQSTKLGGSFRALQLVDELYVALKYEITPPNY